MLDASKTNSELGWKVHKYLVKKGVETPMHINFSIGNDDTAVIQENFANIMKTLGLDMEDDSLKETPKRVAKMFVNDYSGA
jgi:GTP cyclohydrolase I